MTDTSRSLTTLLSIFADGQADESITPQDMRDLIISLYPTEGSLYISSSAETAIATVDVPVLIAGTSAEDNVSNLGDLTISTSNRITFTGTTLRHLEVMAAVTIVAASGTPSIGLMFAKNGTVLPNTEIQGTATTTLPLGLTVFGGVEVTTDDYIEVFVVNRTDNTNVTANKMYFHVRGVTD